MKVTKAVIPAAGLGTRVLPATKSMPKEMLPIVDKPAIQYIVEEAVNSGITDILIITNRGKGLIEDHFDRAPELEAKLTGANKNEMFHQVVDISKLANIYFVRGKDPACGQLIRAYEEFGMGVLGVKQVSEEAITKYSSLKVEKIRDNLFKCTDMIEKPSKDKIMSLYSILGRCVLTPDIFDILDNTAPGAGGEIQLTDAMCAMARTQGMIAVDYTGKRYDMGNKLGIIQAAVEVALEHPEIGKDFREYLKGMAAQL